MKTDFLEKDLKELESLGTYRSLKAVGSSQGREIVLEGKRVLNFSSNDYLGLANDARIKKAAVEAIEEFGFGAGASRLICGNMGPHEKLEEELAQFKNTESALVYSSGYMANTGIIPALMDRQSVVLSDKLNHASIIDGIILSRAKLLRYPHADMQALERMLKDIPATQRKLIVTDTVFSMDGDTAPLKEIVGLAQRYEATVMVDEAHAFGVLGDGRGLAAELRLSDHIDIQMGTLSKAAGCFGAYVCGHKVFEGLLDQQKSQLYLYDGHAAGIGPGSKGCSTDHPSGGATAQKLNKNAVYLRARLQEMGFDTMNSSTSIIPVLVKDPLRAVAMSKRLLQQGVFVQAIRPPTVPIGASRLRFTVMATHTKEDVDQLLNALRVL